MDPIIGRIPVFVTQRGRHILFGKDKTKGTAADFIVDPAHPHLLSISTPWFGPLQLNRQGVFKGLHEPWTDPERHVTVRPYEAPEVRWLLFDIDVDTYPAAQIATTHDRVAAFLAMAGDLLALNYADVFEAFVPRPDRGGDRETEWTPRWLRRDGGAW
jgi:transcription initiation factor IIF auxiliary subunit